MRRILLAGLVSLLLSPAVSKAEDCPSETLDTCCYCIHSTPSTCGGNTSGGYTFCRGTGGSQYIMGGDCNWGEALQLREGDAFHAALRCRGKEAVAPARGNDSLKSMSSARFASQTGSALSNALVASSEEQKPQGKRPVLRVTSPVRSAYILPSSAKSLLITIEIVDVNDVGIVTNDSGIPKFVEPNKNVELFLRRIVKKGSYVNEEGQNVLQFVSEIPVADLVKEEGLRITPPVEPRYADSVFPFKKGSAVDVAFFNFDAKDKQGFTSRNEADEKVPLLMVGFASGLYAPPTSP